MLRLPSGSIMEETIMRGRYPSGPEYVDVQHLHGSAQAKERLRVILETMMGQWRVGEACERLGICEQRFRQLRAELLQAALERLEGRPTGTMRIVSVRQAQSHCRSVRGARFRSWPQCSSVQPWSRKWW